MTTTTSPEKPSIVSPQEWAAAHEQMLVKEKALTRSRDALTAGGWAVEWHVYPIEHSAAIEEVVAAGAFIARVLTK